MAANAGLFRPFYMNENDKAAIAAGLWEPGQKCDYCEECADPTCSVGDKDWHKDHDRPAPNMHDPANLWRALENRRFEIEYDGRDPKDRTLACTVWYGDKSLWIGENLSDSVFAALVALFNAEHPNQP